MVLSDAPMTYLMYLSSDNTGSLLQGATCRTDVLIGAYTTDKILASLFNDYVSGYSPLSAEVGDYYTFPSQTVISDFIRLGA